MAFHIPGEAAVTRQRQVDSKLHEFANTNRGKGFFNDVVINVENEDFPAHRLILACYSHYFETMFTVEVKEQYEDTVKLNNVDIHSWKILLNFVYTGNIVITCKNVVALLASADYLQVDEAKDYCFEFIESVISMDNCFDILNVANQYSNTFLQKKVYHFISKNFVEISQSPSLKVLNKDDFILFVSSLNLNVVGNSLLYETIIDWVKVDEVSRKNSLPKLLMCLDFSKMPERVFKQNIATERLIIDNLDCASLMLKTTIELLNKKVSEFPSSKIFSIHEEDSIIKVSLIYNLFDDIAQNYPDNPVENIFAFCVLNLDDFVYFLGCTNPRTQMGQKSIAWKLNVIEKNSKWKEMVPMLVQRHAMGASVFKNMIVVAGGRNNHHSIVNSAEVYDLSRNQWQMIPSLNKKRCEHVLVTCEDSIYALGGDNDYDYLPSVEKLRDINGKWQVVQSMSTPRSSFAAVTCKGKIYAIGGYRQGSGGLNTVERYCPQSNEWVAVSSMNHGRRGHSACVLQGRIYVAGGRGLNNCEVNSIESYDPSLDKWNIVGKLDNNHFCHSVFVV